MLRTRKLIALAAFGALVLFILLLLINVAGQGYERQSFTTSSFDAFHVSDFPVRFFGGALKDQPVCDPYVIRQGDGIP
jgi:hypothetical protein